MKTAASAFSWIIGIAYTVLSFVGIGVNKLSPWLYIAAILATAVRLIILIWRQFSVENGEKVMCGVCTIIFVSVVGGILTLCIPEYELWGGYSAEDAPSPAITPATGPQNGLPIKEQERLPSVAQNTEGASVAKPERIEPVLKTEAAMEQAPKSEAMKEEDIVDLLVKYKKLLDEGILTQEEFDAKKAELLWKRSA